MDFIVPQFIERAPKIVGPFTFKQFAFIAVAGAISIFLYFFVPFALFIVIALVLFCGAFALAFLKTGGFPLPTVIKNAFFFLGKPRIFLWRKKTIPPKMAQKTGKPKNETSQETDKEESVLKIGARSHLKNLSTILETKSK